MYDPRGTSEQLALLLLDHPADYPPVRYALHPTPYTLHPTPYTLHPTPYTLHPTPCRPPPPEVFSSSLLSLQVLGP